MSDLKATPAMKKWCHHLSLGRKITRAKGARSGPFYSDTMSTLTSPMANRLQKAGLITWEDVWGASGESTDLVRAVLTEAGSKAAGVLYSLPQQQHESR